MTTSIKTAFLLFTLSGTSFGLLLAQASTHPAPSLFTSEQHIDSDTIRQAPPTIKTEVLTPETIRITLEDLPAPYASESAKKNPKDIDIPKNPVLQAPQGFSVNVFAKGLDKARTLRVAPNGDVFVVQSKENKITVLRDSNQDGVADQRYTFAEGKKQGLDQPFGIDFHDGYLYIANTDGAIRYPYQDGQTEVKGKHEDFITGITSGGYNQHWTRNILFHDEKVYYTVGSDSNVDPEELPRASIQTFDLDGSNQQTYASGLRNPVGIAFNPVTNQLWASVNERDKLGDNLVPDYFTHVEQSAFYGWPYAYLSASNVDPRREGEAPELVEKTVTPDILFQSHSAALGVVFYEGNMFPQTYQGDAFVAFHGSWNRSQGTGYKVVRVPFDERGQPEGGYEDFVTGWLTKPKVPAAWGRPVGVAVAADGSLLIAEDEHGMIYRVSYQQP